MGTAVHVCLCDLETYLLHMLLENTLILTKRNTKGTVEFANLIELMWKEKCQPPPRLRYAELDPK